MANGTHLLDVDLKSKSVRVLQSTGGGSVISIHFNANTSQVFICNNQTKEILSTGTVLYSVYFCRTETSHSSVRSQRRRFDGSDGENGFYD